MWVRFKRHLFGDYGRVRRDDERDIDKATAKDLIAKGLAEEIQAPKKAKADGTVKRVRAQIGRSRKARPAKPAAPVTPAP